MKRCKKCKEVISLDLNDLLSGQSAKTKCVDRESVQKGYCKECYAGIKC